MTGPFGMADEFLNWFRSGRAFYSYSKGYLFECGAGSVQSKFVSNIKSATNINLPIFNDNLVKVREPRNLRQQSESRPDEKIGKRSRSEVGPATLFRFVRFQTKTANGPFQVNILDDVCHRAESNLSTVGAFLRGVAKLFMFGSHLVQINSALYTLGHRAPP